MKIPDLDKILETMNEAQRRAVMHGEGPMLVLAGPGSGKTFTITNRISYLILHENIKPENILVITFTKEAALSMQNRFLKLTSQHHTTPDGYGSAAAEAANSLPVNFGTFHSIFYHIIRQSGYVQVSNILKDSDKKHLIIPILTKIKEQLKASEDENTPGDCFDEADRVLASISFYKNSGDTERASRLLQSPWREQFPVVLRNYEKARASEGRIDFDDMVFMCLKLLRRNRELLKQWQSRFQYILIDEFQDINPVQYQVIRLLSPPPYNLFCVGDDDQSIYGFRGSDPSLMQSFLRDYPKASQVLLNVNYRSLGQIVEASQKVVAENRNRFPKQLKSGRDTSAGEVPVQAQAAASPVKLTGFAGKEAQYHYIIEKLKLLTAKELTQSAILFRTHAQMQGFALALSGAGITYSMKEKSACIYDHFIAKDLTAYLKFAAGERSRSLFLQIMNKPSRYISREALTSQTVDFSAMKEYYRRFLPTERGFEIRKRITQLERELSQLAAMKPYLGILYARKAIGYEQYLKCRAAGDRDREEEWMKLLELLTEEAKGYNTNEEWINYQKNFCENWERSSGKENGTESGVRLMTAHASKGLEFDRVYVPDINEGTYPHGKTLSEEDVEEERRMLYVAMTRAKEALELTFVTGTKERPGLVSRFLRPLL